MPDILLPEIKEHNWVPYLPVQKISKDVHIFSIPAAGTALSTETLAEIGTILSADEIERMRRIQLPAMKENFKRSRYFLRSILSVFLNQHPADLKFNVQKGKKPSLEGLSYNLSRSADFIVIAVSKQIMGIDLEYIKPGFSFTDICEQHFHPDEQQWAGRDSKRFFTIWTRKEAILKATGEGLIDDLTSFSTTKPALKRAGLSLHIKSYQMKDNYILSLATTEANSQIFLWQL